MYSTVPAYIFPTASVTSELAQAGLSTSAAQTIK
tara:strand:+ start:1495 stop:1596 length:102 start_codon:yes stop_codon:yes gene_type:complete